MNDIKTIIFDLDGVLWELNFKKLGLLVAQDLKIEENLIEDFTKEVLNIIRVLLHTTDQFITKELILDRMKEAELEKYKVDTEQVYNSLMKVDYNYCENNPESLPVIKELYERGYNLVIKTNWVKDIQIENLKRYGYYPYFSKVVGLLNSYVKPNPLSIKEIIEDNNPLEYIIVGDSPKKEMKLANYYHMKSIWLNEANQELPADDSIKPTYEIHNIKEILDILK